MRTSSPQADTIDGPETQIREVESVFCDKMGVDEIGLNCFYQSFYCKMAGDERKVEIVPSEDMSTCSVTPGIIRSMGS